MNTTGFDLLFSPLRLGNLNAKNRVFFLAHRTNFSKDGRLNNRLLAYYLRRARGGCGLIIVGELCISPNDQPWGAMVKAYRPEILDDYKRLTERFHSFETLIFGQLCHHGFQSSGDITREAIWGPSPVSDIEHGEICKPMEADDIRSLIQSFSQSAELLREGGFDGIEIDIGHASLLRQFLSPLSNFRDDAYGGSLENRLRLSMEVIEGVREKVGSDYTVGVRLCCDEKFWGAITIEETQKAAQLLEKSGKVDYFNISVGSYYNLYLVSPTMHVTSGFTVETAAKIREVVSHPVIASQQIDIPEMAEGILKEGKADAIGVVRSLICDPDWPDKAMKGEIEDIRVCLRDNQGCVGRVNQTLTLSCTQNPEVGFEDRLEFSSEITEHRRKGLGREKRVMVIGGGPAGLSAALSAVRKGYDVEVLEKREVVGGQINLAKRGVGRERIAEIIRYLIRAAGKSHLSIRLNTEATRELVVSEDPDIVIVATGSTPKAMPVSGSYGPPYVLTIWDVLEDRFQLGERILFVDEDGGHRSTATVEWLAERGKDVDMITSESFVGINLAVLGDLYLTRQRLLQKGVTFITGVVIDEINGTFVKGHCIYTGRDRDFEGYDTLVLCMGNTAADSLYFDLKGSVKELYRVGDCVAPRGFDSAVFEGWKIGEVLG